jgi:hypothetical protein
VGAVRLNALTLGGVVRGRTEYTSLAEVSTRSPLIRRRKVELEKCGFRRVGEPVEGPDGVTEVLFELTDAS